MGRAVLAAVAVGVPAAALLLRRLLRTRSTAQPGSAPVKLYYWPATGKAETIRLLLVEAGCAFENVCFDKEAGLQIYADAGSFVKAKTSDSAQRFFDCCRDLGHNLTTNTPMLEVDGHFYTQSTAIYRCAHEYRAHCRPLWREPGEKVWRPIA